MTNPKLNEAGAATRFKPGKSGNPSGRPKEGVGLKELARSHTKDAIRTLLEIMRSKRSPAAARVSAANALLDRGYGKATQPIGGDADVPLEVFLRDPRPQPCAGEFDSQSKAPQPPANGHSSGSEEPEAAPTTVRDVENF